MIYSFPQLSAAKSRFLTYNTVRAALVRRGHTVLPDLTDNCDAVLYSACDVMDMPGLRKLRKETRHPLVVGGHYAMNYWSAALYSDFVWLGEIYDFGDLTSIDEIGASPHVYYAGRVDTPRPSMRIEWGEVPITQIKRTSAYYWGGVGCKNRCRFCFTSWTHRHQENGKARIDTARQVCDAKKVHLMVVSNAYDYDASAKTKDMLLVDYIRRPVSGTMIRCGVEFATEEVRERNGKSITRNDIYAALQKMGHDGIALKLFHIAGYEPVIDWDAYINDLAEMLHIHPNPRLLQLEFNNLQYQNYTPLYRERMAIDPDRYIDHHKTRSWYDLLRQYSAHVLIGAPSPFVHVACRMGIELSGTLEQAEYWFYMLGRKTKISTDEAYRSLFGTGVLDQPWRKFNPNTGEIKVCNN